MVFCKECLMNDSIEEFKIVEDGLCNFCIDWKNHKKNYGNFTDQQVNSNLLSLKKLILKGYLIKKANIERILQLKFF